MRQIKRNARKEEGFVNLRDPPKDCISGVDFDCEGRPAPAGLVGVAIP